MANENNNFERELVTILMNLDSSFAELNDQKIKMAISEQFCQCLANMSQYINRLRETNPERKQLIDIYANLSLAYHEQISAMLNYAENNLEKLSNLTTANFTQAKKFAEAPLKIAQEEAMALQQYALDNPYIVKAPPSKNASTTTQSQNDSVKTAPLDEPHSEIVNSADNSSDFDSTSDVSATHESSSFTEASLTEKSQTSAKTSEKTQSASNSISSENTQTTTPKQTPEKSKNIVQRFFSFLKDTFTKTNDTVQKSTRNSDLPSNSSLPVNDLNSTHKMISSGVVAKHAIVETVKQKKSSKNQSVIKPTISPSVQPKMSGTTSDNDATNNLTRPRSP